MCSKPTDILCNEVLHCMNGCEFKRLILTQGDRITVMNKPSTLTITHIAQTVPQFLTDRNVFRTEFKSTKPCTRRVSFHSVPHRYKQTYGRLNRVRDSSVGIATRYRLQGTGIESLWGARFSAPVQTGRGAHPASYSMGTGSSPGVKRPRRGLDRPHPPL